jgi:hypothetical protein
MDLFSIAKLSFLHWAEKKADEWHNFFQSPASHISDPFHSPAHPHWRKMFYSELAGQQPDNPFKLLGYGSEAMAVKTTGDNVLKFSYKPDVTYAARSGLDIPTIATYSHELGSAAGSPVYAVKQPLAQVSDSFWDNLKGNVELRNKAKAMNLNPVDLVFGFKQTGVIDQNGVPTRVLLDRGAVLDSPRSAAPLLSRIGHGAREKFEDLLVAGHNRPNALRALGSIPLLAYLAKRYANKEKIDPQTTAGLGAISAAPWAIRGIDVKGIMPVPGAAKFNVRGGLPAAGLAGLGGLLLAMRKGKDGSKS